MLYYLYVFYIISSMGYFYGGWALLNLVFIIIISIIIIIIEVSFFLSISVECHTPVRFACALRQFVLPITLSP